MLLKKTGGFQGSSVYFLPSPSRSFYHVPLFSQGSPCLQQPYFKFILTPTLFIPIPCLFPGGAPLCLAPQWCVCWHRGRSVGLGSTSSCINLLCRLKQRSSGLSEDNFWLKRKEVCRLQPLYLMPSRQCLAFCTPHLCLPTSILPGAWDEIIHTPLFSPILRSFKLFML